MEQTLKDQIYQDYLRANKLYEQKGTEQNPFEHIYEAREILHNIVKFIEDDTSDEGSIIRGSLEYFIGKIHYITEDRPSAVKSFEKALWILEAYQFDPRAISCILKTTNELGIVWSEREESSKAFDGLRRAEKIYDELGEKSIPLESIWDSWEVLKCESDRESDLKRKEAIEDVFTHTLFFLSQATQTLGRPEDSAVYCGRCLHRQLRKISTVEEYRQFALHAACLGQYYITIDDYCTARVCLLASKGILSLIREDDETIDEEFRQKLSEATADISRCWIKYCVAFLEWSSQKLSFRSLASELEDLEDSIPKRPKIVFDLTRFRAHESELRAIPHDAVQTLKEANQVHKKVEVLCSSSLEFFKMDGYVTDNIEITQDLSKSWRFLAEFDTNFERRCKMHKRRIDLLIPLLKELNAQFYLQVIRQLQYEIGEVYSEMTDLKISLANIENTPSVHQIKKINVLANSGIKFFTGFIDSTRNPDKTFPDTFEQVLVRPFLMAHFHTARLYGKLMSVDKNTRIEWTKKSWSSYKMILTVCEKDPSARGEIADEYELIREMDILMPQKLSQIASLPC